MIPLLRLVIFSPLCIVKCPLFFSGDKPIERNKNKEESNDSEIEEKYQIKISKLDKSQSTTKEIF